ncbi:type II toxin-antitoxin system VapC family toxin [Inquilinus limosus]|uniref:Ribonuclease VapC n=1 Tax=Inquilinus limosus MP06 TaxID=1398085 RepID=A0A0A0CUN3_9PROT|nr:type II toxin-antitoxin system VapC family toxin [Inquilinus limosus]KGM30171.1 twitching motility protein PilT [Inquilinus limosus MP06]
MFVDTSVIVALIAGEPDAPRFVDLLSRAERRLTSGLVILEAAMRLSTLLRLDPVRAEALIHMLLDEADINIVPIDSETATAAVAAFAAYGKGRGHAAQLNLADCMSYACARTHGVPLLFKGDDFSKTDIQAAAGPA